MKFQLLSRYEMQENKGIYSDSPFEIALKRKLTS